MSDNDISERLNDNCLYTFNSLDREEDFRKSVQQLPTQAPAGAREPIEYNIFRTGRFKHPFYGDDLEFDQEYLESIVNNFKNGVVPERLILNVGHNSDNQEIGAIGHIDDVKLKGGKIETPFGEKERIFLRGRMVLNSMGIELFKDRRYLFSSSEIHPDYTTREKFDISDETEGGDDDGEQYGTVSNGPTLTGLAATNKPFINNLGQTVETDNFSFSEEMQSGKEPRVFSKPVVENDGGNEAAYGNDMFVFANPDGDKLKNNLSDDNKGRENEEDSRQNFSQPENVEFEGSEQDSDETEQVQEESENSDSTSESKDLDDSEQDSHYKTHNTENNTMELSELFDEIDGMDLSEQVDYIAGKVDEFSGHQKDVVEQLYKEKRERLQAEKARKEAVNKSERYKQEKEELEEQTVELTNKLTEAKEGSKNAQVKQFAKQLEDDGYKQSTVNKVKDCLMSLSADQFEESYELTFSGPEGGDQEKDLSIMGMFEEVFSTMDSGPVSEEMDLEEDPEATVENSEKEVNPDEGAEETDEEAELDIEFDEGTPEKVKKFARRTNYLPEEKEWSKITEDGFHKVLEAEKIDG